MDVNQYIGIPFKHHGRSLEGADCYGLVRLVIEQEFSKTLPDFWKYEDAEDVHSISTLFGENTEALGYRVEVPEPGNVVLYRFRGYTSHIAVYVGDGKILHIMQGMNSVCVPMEKGFLRGRIEGFYAVK